MQIAYAINRVQHITKIISVDWHNRVLTRKDIYLKGSPMKKYLVCFAITALGITGCATPVNWAATGGSRSDGTVKLSYQYGAFQQPVVNNQQGVDLASQKCQAWGYTNAEPFGGATRVCIDSNQYGCDAWRVTAEFQCLGSPSK